MPPDQTVEGGAQIRVTPQGFNKLTSILPGVINSSLSNGFCVPTGQAGSFGTFGTGVRWCTTTQGTCAPGCKVDVTLNSLTPTVTNQQTMNLRLSTAVHTSVPIDGKVIGIGFSCTLNANSNNLNGDVDIAFGIDPATGELTIHVARINSFQTNLSFSGCSVLSDIANLLSSFVDSFLGQFIIQLLTPTIDDLIQNFLPSPLGIAGMMDVGNLLENVSPGTTASMEARIVPGGYVSLNNGGMSLGVITGLNADEDISTRTPGLASEPALCVPPLTAPNFGAPPASLPITTRSTFALNVANEFNGAPDPGADLAMGISETTLDLAGHHMVTSGAMCLGVGTSFINQLNVGTIGILVPSLSELQSDAGNDPLLLVTRPTRPLDFTIGDNTEASPALTIGVSHLEVDFYAFLYERYVRAFTLDLSLNIGVNLTFEQMPGQPAVIKPSLVGISKDKVQLVALNTQFVRETPQELETKLPAVFDLVTPLLGDLPPINVPTFAGFSLENLSIQHVVTNQDDFLALFASLGTNQALRGLAQHDRFALDAVTKLEAQIPTAQAQSAGTSRFLRVTTPPPDQIRAALDGKGGAMPEVVFDVDRYDAFGRELEWAYNLNGGMFHVYQPGGTLAIRDGAFAWQGKYTIGLKSRVKGDYHTVSQTSYKTVNVDSVGPRVLADKATWDDGIYELQTWDIVSGAYLQYAFSKPGAAGPESPWMDGSTIQLSRVDMDPYLVDNEFALYAKDEAGNVTIALIAPFHGQPGEGGCNCDASGGPTPGGILLVLVVGGILLAPRRRVLVQLARRYNGIATVAVWAGLSITLSLVPGCSCGKNAAKSCDTAADCGEDYCPQGQIPFCIDNTCVCSDDIILGKLGPYSDVAVGADGSTWVSAYHQEYGDLVVAKVDPLAGRVPDEAWEWVDGVPEGPVIVPDSKYRHGIAEKGADVGMYTSIAVAPDGTPVVTYFDRDTASLKFAARVGGVWQSHVIEQGTGDLAETGALIGMYTSLTLRSDDGRPGVAYLAHVADTVNGARAEVRFAAAQTTLPTSAADWMTWTVDTAPLPPDDPNNPNIYPLPEGLGLFVDAARLPTQAPVVVYYDRSAGELKLAKFNTTTGQFAAPVVLAGGGNVDAGWSPSVGVDAQGVVHVAYVDSTNDDLMYVTDAAGATPALVDDGRRIVGTTADGLPKPEYHFVGDDAGMVLANAGTLPMIAYQDATTQELLLATRKTDGTWTHVSIAGATDPWPGAYGFFAADTIAGTDIVMSSWVIDQQASENWVEVFKRPTTIQ